MSCKLPDCYPVSMDYNMHEYHELFAKNNILEKFANSPVLICLDISGYAYYADQDINSPVVWTKISGKHNPFSSISYSDGQLLACSMSGVNEIYYSDNYKTSNWITVPRPGDSMAHIFFDTPNNLIIVVNIHGQSWWADQRLPTSTLLTAQAPNWSGIPSSFAHVSYSNLEMFGVNTQGTIYYLPKYNAGNWTAIPADSKPTIVQNGQTFKFLSFDNSDNKNPILIAIDSSGRLYYADKDLKTGPNWTRIPGCPTIVTWVTISNKQVYCIDIAGDIYYGNKYNSDKWIKLENDYPDEKVAKIKQITFYSAGWGPPTAPPTITTTPIVRVTPAPSLIDTIINFFKNLLKR